MTDHPQTVVAVFTNRKNADKAARDLRQAGFTDEQIGVATRDKRRGISEETYAEEGAVTGVVAGAGAGALIGLGVLAGVIPVVGPVIAGGTLAVILANAAGGAAIAGLVGALIGMGIPEEEAQFYEGEVKAGRTVVSVRANGRADEALTILRRHGGYDRETVPARKAASRANGAAAAEERTLQLKEEQLHAHTTPVTAGEVRVRKNVVTEHRTIDVPLRREEVTIERRPVKDRPAASAPIREGDEVRVPVREERVTVEKHPVVREEVRVGKRTVTDREQVHGAVRREEARVEREGDVDVQTSDSATPRRR